MATSSARTGKVSRSAARRAMPVEGALPRRRRGAQIHVMRFAPLSALVLALAGLPRATHAQAAPKKPALVVLVTIDQFRGDYLDRFGPQLTGGIARLVRGGAVFTNAHHDHAITETAPGHATLLAGRFPRSTRIMMNSIGVADTAAPLLAGGYGTGASPRRFTGTTLADWLRAANAQTRVLSVSMKDRAAILPIGRSRSDVYWYSPDGRFVTSKYYGDSLPAWVNKFNDARHVAELRREAMDAPASGHRVCGSRQRPRGIRRRGLHLSAPAARRRLRRGEHGAHHPVHRRPRRVVRARRRHLAQAGDGPGHRPPRRLALRDGRHRPPLRSGLARDPRSGPPGRPRHRHAARLAVQAPRLQHDHDRAHGRPRRGHDPRDRTGERAAAPRARVVRQAAERDPRRHDRRASSTRT